MFEGVLSLDHTAIAVRSVESVLPFYRDLLGGTVLYEREVARSGFRFVHVRYPNGSVLELLEPLGQSGFLHDFLARRGEGLHHLTFIVADLKQAVAAARSAGYRVVGESYGNPRWQEAFVSPRDLRGTLVQLAQKGDAEDDSAPPSPCSATTR